MSDRIVPATDIEWTPRQREVLDLLAKSRSNSEIAAELGISLDGAKWHVSEILAKLGARSRDEAADYWRIRNGMRPRLVRSISAFAASTALRWTAAALGLALVGGAVLIALQADGGDESIPAATDTPTATVVPSESPATSTPATPTPVGDGLNTPLASGAPASVEPGWLIEYYIGCWGCGGGGPTMRAYLGPNGLVRETVSDVLPGLNVYRGAVDYTGQYQWAAVCLEGECGPINEASPDARNAVYVSTDGGHSWAEQGSLEPNVFFASRAVGDRVMTYTGPQAGRVFRWWDTGEVIEPPLPFPTAFPVWVGPNDEVLWSAIDVFSYVYAWGDGTPVPIQLGEEVGTLEIFDWDADYFWASFSVDLGDGETSRRIGIFGFDVGEQAFTLSRSWSWPGDVLWPIAVVSGNRVIARAEFVEDPCLTWGCPVADPPRSPAIEIVVINTDTATIHPIVDLDVDTDGNPLIGNRHALVSSVVQGRNIARVATGGQCLPVRAEPSLASAETACYRDGWLLWQVGEPVEAGGTLWVPIDVVPGEQRGAPAWAPAASLELQ